MKVAIVYDRVNKWGGAERVLLDLHQIWPKAPLYTAVYDEEKASWAKVFPKVIPSFLQKFPFAKSHHELYPWLTPLAFETFNFDEFDLVISVTSAEAKGIITKPKTKHVCICLTPTRYLWQDYFTYLNGASRNLGDDIIKFFMPLFTHHLRMTDQIAATRPDKIIAISKAVQDRIFKYYKRESVIVYPGVDTDFFKVPSKKVKSDYFLIVSRLVAYKRIELAVKVFNELGWNLKIVGIGKELENLTKIAKNNIEFVGELTDEALLRYYQHCEAIIFPGEEDFGLTSLEAQSCGKPVIALGRGGVAETIVNGKTGLFFREPTVNSLIAALKEFKTKKFLATNCRNQALKFSKAAFKKQIKEIIKFYEQE